MKYNYNPNWQITVCDRTRGSTVFYGFVGRNEAMVVNAKRGKYLQKIECRVKSKYFVYMKDIDPFLTFIFIHEHQNVDC